MKAFLNDKKVQKKVIARLGEIVKGEYCQDDKGCAVCCTVNSSPHNCYEIELGIPEWIARLETVLCGVMLNEKSKEFPLKLLKSIPLGFDNWQYIYHQLCVFVLEKICKNTDNTIVVKAICDIITLHKTESKDEAAWSTARSAAWSVRSTVDYVGLFAARSAAESAVEYVVLCAAEYAALHAAEHYAWSAWSDAFYKISEELIRLLKEKSI